MNIRSLTPQQLVEKGLATLHPDGSIRWNSYGHSEGGNRPGAIIKPGRGFSKGHHGINLPKRDQTIRSREALSEAWQRATEGLPDDELARQAAQEVIKEFDLFKFFGGQE